jgi:hypothetical protein
MKFANDSAPPAVLEALEGRTLLSLSAPWQPPWAAEQSSALTSSGATRDSISASAENAPGVQPLRKSAKAARLAAERNALRVSDNGRYLVNSDGSPFFYMADTAWHLLNKTTLKQANAYLKNRANHGFTVIQTEINTRFGASRIGIVPFHKNDISRPNEEFFKRVDYVITRANDLGMYVSLVPLDTRWARNGVFTPTNAYNFGLYLGRRYATKKIIWTLGGDIGATEVAGGIDLWKGVAAGIARGAAGKDQSKLFMQYHPGFNQTSATWFQDYSWIDANGVHSGHSMNRDNYNLVANTYNASPAKPVMDMEPGYEDMPHGIVRGNPRLTAYDVRKGAYWSLFAGAHGVTYAHNNVWAFVKEPGEFRSLSTAPWQQSLNTPGAAAMTHLKKLILSRPFLTRIPDQSLIAGPALNGTDHIQATRASDGAYAFIYTASGKPITADLNKLSGTEAIARWYNPRTGESTDAGRHQSTGPETFTPPTNGGQNGDWVLILDDASRGFGNP